MLRMQSALGSCFYWLAWNEKPDHQTEAHESNHEWLQSPDTMSF